MERLRINVLVSVLLVATSLVGLLIPYSLLVGWNIFSSLLFWFVLVPTLSMLSAKVHTEGPQRWIVALAGCLLFYAGVIFMIYSHYQTDFFQLMIVSVVWSVLSIGLLSSPFTRRKFPILGK